MTEGGNPWRAEYLRPLRLLLVAVFGVAGGFGRYFISIAATRALHVDSFYGTIAANMLGCTLMGVVHVLGVERDWLNRDVRVGIMVGLIGGLTTFSSYALDCFLLFDEAAGEDGKAAARSVGAGIANLVCQPIVGAFLMLSAIYLTRATCDRWVSKADRASSAVIPISVRAGQEVEMIHQEEG